MATKRSRSKSLLERAISRGKLTTARVANVLRDAGVPLTPRAWLVYHKDYVSNVREAAARHAFDIWRAQRIVEQLERAGLVSPATMLTPEPVRREDLELVHTPEFLDELTDEGRLAQLLFLAPEARATPEELLRPFLLQTGGTILALERAVRQRATVFNLGGGFHHAQRDRAEGFCPVNDVAVAIRVLQQKRLASKILVLDLDYHHGNGTALIFSQDEGVFTLSIHGQSWARIEGKRNNLDLELPPGTRDERYLEAVRRALDEVLARFKPDVAVYLAGADPHEDDDLGDFCISEEGMLDRDLHVLQTLEDADVPCAVVLAGGYGSMAWTVAYNMVCSTITGTRIAPAHRPSNIEARFRRVKESLTTTELQTGAGELTEADLEDLLGHHGTGGLFMDHYTTAGLEIALERYGYLDMLRERGFDKPLLSTDMEDPDRQIMRIHFDKQDTKHLLVELVVRFHNLITPADAVAEGAEELYRVLCIDWLLMQNPRASFSLERQKLPGQVYPGLGLGRWTVELLRMMAERLDCTGLMNIPQHYHNAYLYSKQMLCFYPDDQGYLEAMKRDLRKLPLVEASVAIDGGRLREGTSNEQLVWEGKAQVMPVEPVLNRYFIRKGYIRAVAAARERYRFRLA
jgi:acetoin utilization deacetylase AcuC-like enzyme